MAGASLLSLLDDLATLLDDVSILTKVAAKKTAGVLGDDLALNAQQVAGVAAERELPVVWAVARGSLVNKAILVPAALLVSALAPWAVTPLLMIGGAYLCFEGVEKLLHRWLEPRAEHEAREAGLANALKDPAVDLVALEKSRIKGAVRTDFILSAEIVAITLGVVAAQPFAQRLGVLAGVALLMTFGVYGFVAGIVKLDDLGVHLAARPGALPRKAGRLLLLGAPWLMKGLSVAGTAAMFLVGGGILTHGFAPVGHAIEAAAAAAGPWLGWLVSALGDALFGAAIGALVVGAVVLAKKLLHRRGPPAKTAPPRPAEPTAPRGEG